MSTAFVVAGFVLMAVGLFLLLRPPRTAPPTGAPQALPDIGKWLEELRKLLEAFDQRLRVGVFIVLLGFALSLVGVWLDVRDTNDKVDPPPAPAAVDIFSRP